MTEFEIKPVKIIKKDVKCLATDVANVNTQLYSRVLYMTPFYYKHYAYYLLFSSTFILEYCVTDHADNVVLLELFLYQWKRQRWIVGWRFMLQSQMRKIHFYLKWICVWLHTFTWGYCQIEDWILSLNYIRPTAETFSTSLSSCLVFSAEFRREALCGKLVIKWARACFLPTVLIFRIE